MTVSARPSVRFQRFADALRGLRTDLGLSRKQVSERTGVNHGTLYRIEACRVRPQARTLDALLTFYGVQEDQRRALTQLLEESGQVEWLQAYADVFSEPFCAALELEDEANTVHTYDPLHVPDLLQTPDYTRAVAGLLEGADRAAECRVAVQRRRQDALTRQNRPLRLWVVCEEAVLWRHVGGPGVMGEQLRHLVKMAELPNVTLQLIPLQASAHPGTPRAFTVMDLPGETDAVYVDDAAAGERVLTGAADVGRCADLFARLQDAALPPAASVELITAHARHLGVMAAARRLGHSNASVTTRHYARALEGADDDIAVGLADQDHQGGAHTGHGHEDDDPPGTPVPV